MSLRQPNRPFTATGSLRRWTLVYLVIVAALTAAYLQFPERHTVLWALIGLGGVAAILVGVHLHQPSPRWPWLVLAAANLAFVGGDTAYNALEAFFGQTRPFPSVADALYLATYPLFAIGLFGFIRYRAVGRDLGVVLDALILTSGLALLSWVNLITPLARSEDMSWTEKAISIAYPLGDVLMLAMLARLLVPGGLRSRSVQLLTLGTCGILASDVIYGTLQLRGTWQVGTPWDLGWVVFFTAWGLAALHPSMTGLTERAPEPAPRVAERRLALLAGASLVAPALLLFQSLRHDRDQDIAVIAIFSALMFLLVLARLWGMMNDHDKAEARERSLRMAAASLVAALSPREVAGAVETASATLFGPGTGHRVLLLTRDRRGGLSGVATAGRPWSCRTDELTRPPTPAPRTPNAPTPTSYDSTPPANEPSGNQQPTPFGAGPAPPLTDPPRTATAPPHQPSGTAWPETVSDGTRLLPVSRLAPAVAAELAPETFALLCPLELQAPAGHEPLLGVLLIAGPEKKLAEISGPAQSLASQAALALERFALSEEVNRRTSEAYFRTLVHNTSDVILIVDDDDTVRYASPSAESMFGRSLLPGTPLTDLVAPADTASALRVLADARTRAAVDARDDWKLLHGGQADLEVEVRCSNLRDENTVHGLVLTLRDVTEQRKLERELTHRAFHDSLTGLPNRVLLLERVERALLRGRRESTLTCMLFVDLDDFKVVNDTMGHSVGDELLVSVARRLTSVLRLSDTAARLGGDEFAVLIEGAREPRDAETLAAEIVHTLSQPFHLTDGAVSVSTSVGIATVLDSAHAEELLGHADLALYAAKAAGKKRWRLFHPEFHSKLVARHELQAGMDTAIADKAFALRYQPIVEVRDGAPAGLEALIRWPHARRGMVPPDQFIALAEESGHIMPLGAWVLEHAALDIARWQQALPRKSPLYASVNVSARQFRDPGFLEGVRRTLHSSGLVPGSLVLELTETVLMRRDAQIRTTMAALKDLGVSIAIDDFGTGFSSLSYLREFPIDVLKVDKSFIDNITTDPQQVALVEGIVRIADVLGLQVVAEGIEHEEQRALLADMGCRYGQGYLFARPMTAHQAESYLHRARPSGPRPPARPAVRPAARAGHPPRASRWRDLEHLHRTSRMCDAVIDEIDGRRIRVGDDWLIDFASCNYLGLDLDPTVIEAIEPEVRRWGTHPSWSRLIGSPRLYPRIEERLTELLGASDTLLLPTISLIHQSVIPLLAGTGQVFVEAQAHRTVYDGCVVARGQGAEIHRFHAERPDELEALLRGAPADASRLICMDGVNSMTGNFPDLPTLARVSRENGALLYIDDAHGFGVIGERLPGETSPYGSRGNSIVRHLGETYDDLVLVGGFSKAFSSLLAFLAVPKWLKDHLKVAAAPYLYSGPSPTASLATALAGLDVNDARGDEIRAGLYRKTARVLAHVRALGIATPNTDGLPIIEIPLAEADDLDQVAAFLWEHGIYVTLASYPLVPRDRVGFRIQITAANTDEEIEELCTVLTRLAARFPLQAADAARPSTVTAGRTPEPP
ncbi:aminotransferase class I/II-fold pyridoxal phosphate-dependent enzyme [Streptomyces sp. TX20-6-3]|uniref:aminotransferase class I/II-fold pyridoxal phosphate-dependent enzyme n=1 Tax=Streptomyces sp. TX20-6-3 TaxID=3028705 RepID=UPI0029AF827E|nr:aminotransferase class I/II-fold pyridoxal phosphate-dependent enzyme [Streptomyces sp. TX20-6-3]MDX2560819.1 aminotransferase class I/II-fold pyridoxal phosphate-dependent enzyme [Streptomyces sp. TX20-6-3]